MANEQNNNGLPIYWTEELQGLSVFGVVKDTLEKHPEVLEEVKEFIKDLKEKRLK